MKENIDIMEEIGELENYYWWYKARLRILESIFTKQMHNQPSVLNLGCGMGSLTESLARFGKVVFSDYSYTAVKSTKNKGFPSGFCADISYLPARENKFDYVILLDVLEHIENEITAINEIKRVLKQDGRLLISVPAYQWLWTKEDELQGHFRRYSRPGLQKLLEDNGFISCWSTHLNSFLFLPALVNTLIRKTVKRNPEKYEFPKFSPFVNRLFYSIFSFERHFLPKPGFPFGLSILACYRCQN